MSKDRAIRIAATELDLTAERWHNLFIEGVKKSYAEEIRHYGNQFGPPSEIIEQDIYDYFNSQLVLI